jgi:hypothetical protein
MEQADFDADPDEMGSADPDASLLDLVDLAVAKGDLDTARRALDLIEARRRERAGRH